MKKIQVLMLFLCILSFIVIFKADNVQSSNHMIQESTRIFEKNSEAIIVEKNVNYQNSFSTFLESQQGDSKRFGHALAVSKKYLAVGDTDANRVVIYGRQANDSWLRLYEVYPPNDSLTETRGYGFGYDLALNDNSLVIYSYDYKNNKDYLPANKAIYDQSIYLVTLNQSSAEFTAKIKKPRMDLYFGGIHFLDNQLALTARVKGFFGTFRTYIFLIDPQTGKSVKNIKILDSNYNNLSKYDLSSDSNNKSIVILLSSNHHLKENLPLSITGDGQITKIILDRQSIDSVLGKEYSIRSKSIKISKNLLLIGADWGPGALTMFWSNSPQPSLINFINEYYLTEINNYDVLFSVSRGYKMFNSVDYDYKLVRVNRDKKITKSQITWSCNNFINSNIDIDNNPKGIIDSDNLILSFYGDVISIPIRKLSESQVIKHSSCSEKNHGN